MDLKILFYHAHSLAGFSTDTIIRCRDTYFGGALGYLRHSTKLHWSTEAYIQLAVKFVCSFVKRTTEIHYHIGSK